jgi:hypothetical protein
MCLSCLQYPLLCRDAGGERHTCVSMTAWPISQVLALVLFLVLSIGQEISKDITAVHIAIWNEGRESIRQEHMLQSLTIETEYGTPILETKISKVTRHVTGFTLDESRCVFGILGVSWDILEKHDCGIIQIIYAGAPNLLITAHATIEGQGEIIDYSYISQLLGGKKAAFKSLRLIFLLFLIFNLEVYLYFTGSELSSWGQTPSSWTFWTLYSVILLGAILYGCWVLLKILRVIKQQRPPLEF